MVNDIVMLFSGSVPLTVIECVKWKHSREDGAEDALWEQVGHAGRVLVRCRDCSQSGDPRQAKESLDECAVELLNVIPRIPHELAFFALDYYASCAAEVRCRQAA